MRVRRRFRIRPVPCAMSSDGPYARLIELWILRCLVHLKVADMFDTGPWLNGETVLRRVGLKKYANEENGRIIRDALRRRLLTIEKETPQLTDGPLFHNLSGFTSMLGLGEAEREIITFLVLLRSDGDLAAVLNALGRVDLLKIQNILSIVLARPQENIDAALRVTAVLRQTGIITFDFDEGEDFGSSVEIAHGLHDVLLEPHPDPALLLDHLVPRSATASLAASNFVHIQEDFSLMRDYLGNLDDMGLKGCNILIYGQPGTGKTELVRTLCQDLGFMLHEVATQDREGKPLGAKDRLAACHLSQHLLARHAQTALLFDEIEDVFPRDSLFNPRENASRHKAWINRLLEGGLVPTFWLSNSIAGMDPAYLRRFDYILKLKVPGISVRTQLLKSCFVPLGVSDAWIERLARFDEITPAHAERAARVGQCVAGHDGPKVERVAERVLQNMLQASGMKAKRTVQGNHATRYDLAHVNADQDLETVIAGVGRSGAGRLCLYGPSGTGKTAFGHYLAERIEQPVVAARSSELLGMYVGETESNIAELFERARTENAIVILDEVDSFLQDRGNSVRSWEVTQVNELLVQMENFDGIFIASTNLVSHLDAAAFRRFDFKIRFDSLKPAQRFAMFCGLLRAAGWPGADELNIWSSEIGRLDTLTPGDFATVARQMRILGKLAEPRWVIDALRKECAAKPGASRMQLGFTGPGQAAPRE